MEPTGNGIGGDLFAIVWDPKTKKLHGLNGSGRSAKGQTLSQLKLKITENLQFKRAPSVRPENPGKTYNSANLTWTPAGPITTMRLRLKCENAK